jgi:hypothetical protein
VTDELESKRDVDDDMELKLSLPGIVSVTWRRRWTARRETVVDRAAELGNVSQEQLGKRVRDDEPFGDVFWRAVHRAGDIGDEDYLDALGRLVAAALDHAQVDEVAYLTSEVVKLDAVQMRTLARVCFRYFAVPDDPEIALVPLGNPDHAHFGQPRRVRVEEVTRVLQISEPAALGVLLRLTSAGFLLDVTPQNAPAPHRGVLTNRDFIGNVKVPATNPEVWEPTAWANKAIKLLYPNLTHGLTREVPFDTVADTESEPPDPRIT